MHVLLHFIKAQYIIDFLILILNQSSGLGILLENLDFTSDRIVDLLVGEENTI